MIDANANLLKAQDGRGVDDGRVQLGECELNSFHMNSTLADSSDEDVSCTQHGRGLLSCPVHSADTAMIF